MSKISNWNECHRQLVSAGAELPGSFLIYLLNGSKVSTVKYLPSLDKSTKPLNLQENFKLAMKSESIMIDLEGQLYGRTPLAEFSAGGPLGYDPSCLQLLLERGADIHTLEQQTGRNCLHLFLLRSNKICNLDEKKILLLLVQARADIHAADNDGNNVSDTAYREHPDNEIFGGYTGDLWDAVLSECGHNIAEFRRGFPRKPRYNNIYTRECFEGLWRGREEYCPYYHDPPVWKADENDETDDPTEGEVEERMAELSDTESEYATEGEEEVSSIR